MVAGPARRPHFDALPNTPGITRSSSKYSGFNELAFNLGAATVDNKPIGNGHPALKDKQVRMAIDYAIDRKTLVDKVLRGHATAATRRDPAALPGDPLEPAAGAERAFDLGQGQPDPGRGGLRQGRRRRYGSGRTGKQARAAPLRPRRSRSTPSGPSNTSGTGSRTSASTVVVSIMSEDQLTDGDRQGRVRHVRVGLGASSPTPTSSSRCSPAASGPLRTAARSRPAGRTASTATRRTTRSTRKQKTLLDPAARAAVVKQAQQMLYDDAVYSMLYYYNNLEAYRSDRFTGFVRQPDRRRLAGLPVRHLHLPRHRRRCVAQTEEADNQQPRPVLGVGGGAVVLVGAVGRLGRAAPPVAARTSGSSECTRPRPCAGGEVEGGGRHRAAPGRWPARRRPQGLISARPDAGVRGRRQLLPVPGPPRRPGQGVLTARAQRRSGAAGRRSASTFGIGPAAGTSSSGPTSTSLLRGDLGSSWSLQRSR